MAKTYEMLWDCEFCGQKKLLGKTHRHCPSCGAAQDPARRYFPSDADKVAVEDHVYVGADRVCSACQSPMGQRAEHCGNCGAAMDGAKEVVRKDEGTTAPGTGAPTAADADADADERRGSSQAKGTQPKKRSAKRDLLVVFGFLAFTVTLIGFCAWPETVRVKVTGHAWKHEVKVEQFGPERDEAWCSSMPSGAYKVSRTREVRSHKKVADGQDCHSVKKDNGDGTYSESQKCTTRYRSEPVYDDRCHFTIDRWHYERSLVEAGASATTPRPWPTVQLARTGTCVGCERAGGRVATYTLEMQEQRDKGEGRRCELDEPKWAAMPPGSEWMVDVGKFVSYIDCDSLRAP